MSADRWRHRYRAGLRRRLGEVKSFEHECVHRGDEARPDIDSVTISGAQDEPKDGNEHARRDRERDRVVTDADVDRDGDIEGIGALGSRLGLGRGGVAGLAAEQEELRGDNRERELHQRQDAIEVDSLVEAALGDEPRVRVAIGEVERDVHEDSADGCEHGDGEQNLSGRKAQVLVPYEEDGGSSEQSDADSIVTYKIFSRTDKSRV